MLAETCRNIGVFVFFFKVQKRRENAFFARQVLCPSATLLQPPAWAAQYNTWILIKLTPKGIVFSLLFCSFLFFSFLFFSFLFLFLQSPVLLTYGNVLQESSSSTRAVSKARRVWGSRGREAPIACSARGNIFNNLQSSTRVSLIARPGWHQSLKFGAQLGFAWLLS